MSGAYMADGRRRSSMVHATRGHECQFCGRVAFGNGGEVSHARSHVRKGEAVELLKEYPVFPPTSSRLFLEPNDPKVEKFLSEGFEMVTP